MFVCVCVRMYAVSQLLSAQYNSRARVTHLGVAYSDPLHSPGGRRWMGAQDFDFVLCDEALFFFLISSH